MKYEGVYLTPAVAEEIIALCFKEQATWSLIDLCAKVDEYWSSNGGVQGVQKTGDVVQKALHSLRDNGLCVNVVRGIWRIVSGEENLEEITNDDAVESDSTKSEPDIEFKTTIGSGSQSVYLYYAPAYEELAKYRGESSWPCKIGCTHGRVIDRIYKQGIKTAFPEEPIVGLVIKTDDCDSLERLIHSSLKMAGVQIFGFGGTEWFKISPSALQRFYEGFVSISQILKAPGAGQ